jgi:2-polyprenyl-3-methyl-5-hydroxy-6-metoxy-1,4-benzoquinol methylase
MKYATSERPEIHGLIPGSAKRFLDVGCNDGGFGLWLQHDHPDREVWGIEPNLKMASIARSSLAGVINTPYPDALNEIEGFFDCVTFNHVLEHMMDPWTALRGTAARLTPTGSVIAVIPNIRNIHPVVNLVFRGQWEYAEAGIMDRTHLRFFTRASIRSLFETSGLRITRLIPVDAMARVRYPVASRYAAYVLRDFSYGAFAVRAELPSIPFN